MGKGRPARSNLIVVALALCGTAAALQQTLLIPLLPEFPRLLGTTVEGASWLVTATLLTGAVSVPIISRLADMFGKKQMLLVALFAMTAGSAVGAVSGTIQLLIVGRALQGVGISLVPVGIAIMRDKLPPERLPFGVALMSATLSFGAAAGLPLSGIIAERAGWQGIFWLSCVFSLVMVPVVSALFTESPSPTGGRFDWIGAVLASLALTSLLLALSKGGDWGWGAGRTLLLFVLGLVASVLLVSWELKANAPLIDVRIAMRPVVLLLNVSAALIGFATFANMVITVQLLQGPTSLDYGQGFDTLGAGLWMVPSSLTFGVMAPASAAITRRLGAQTTLLAGTVIMAVSYVVRSQWSSTLLDVVGGSVAVAVGAALAFAGMAVLLMRSVPMTETASANGLNTLLRTVGSSLAGAAVAAVSTLGGIRIGDDVFLTFRALMLVFWIAAGASVVASLLTLPMFRRAGRVGNIAELPAGVSAADDSVP